MQPPETLTKGLNLDTITPAVALYWIQSMALVTMDRMSWEYYVRRLKAIEIVAGAALMNMDGKHGD